MLAFLTQRCHTEQKAKAAVGGGREALMALATGCRSEVVPTAEASSPQAKPWDPRTERAPQPSL